MPAFSVPGVKDEAVRYLELSAADRARLTADACAEACLVLSQYAAHLTRVQQRAEADALLLDERIRKAVGRRMTQQHAYSYDERRVLAVAESDDAVALDNQRVAALAKAARLAFFANRVDKVARAYEVLSHTRRRDRQHGD